MFKYIVSVPYCDATKYCKLKELHTTEVAITKRVHLIKATHKHPPSISDKDSDN